MSRNMLILLGLLTGSLALVGCSKSITAPQAGSDSQAQTLSCPVVGGPGWRNGLLENGIDELKNDPEGWRGNKLRHDMMEDDVGNEVPQEVITIQPKPKNMGASKGKLRFNLIEREVGQGQGEVTPVPVRNKFRQMLTENELTLEAGEHGGVAPAPDPKASNDF